MSATYRYFRLKSTSATSGTDHTVVAEVYALLSGTPLSRAGWNASADTEIPVVAPASFAIDGDAATVWHSEYVATSQPHWIDIDAGAPITFDQIRFKNRNDNSAGGILGYELYVSTNGSTWVAAGSGTAPNTGDPGEEHDLDVEVAAASAKRRGLLLGVGR